MIALEEASTPNVSNYERAFRLGLGLAILVSVLLFAFAPPAVVFAMTMVAVYLILTAALAIDPLYSASKSFANVYHEKNQSLSA